MIVARVYAKDKFLHALKVDNTSIFSVNEDQSGSFSKVAVDVAWKGSASGRYHFTAEIRSVICEPFSYKHETSHASIVAAFGTPMCLADDVFIVLMSADKFLVPSLLECLHFKTIQSYCRCGPAPPFDQLRVAWWEWSDALMTGVGCRAAMIDTIIRRHSRKLLEGNANPQETLERVSCAVCANQCLTVEIVGHSISQAASFTGSLDDDCRVVVGHLDIGPNSTFEVSVTLKPNGFDSETLYRTVLECPKLFTPHHLKPTGAIIFFPTNDLKKSSTRYFEHLESHDDGVHGTYKVELVCLPKPGAIVKPVSLLEASRQQYLFAERDVLEPSVRNCCEVRPVKLSNDFRELGYSVMSTWDAPGIWPMQLTFRYSKTGTRSSAGAARISSTTFGLTQSDIGKTIRLSHSSFLTITLISKDDATDKMHVTVSIVSQASRDCVEHFM